MGEQEPIGWLETVTLDGSDMPVRVVFHERRDNLVVVRQVDPGEPEPPRVPVFDGDSVEVMTAVSYVGVHSEETSDGRSDLIHSMRVVPVRRDGNVVYARTLHHDEADDGRRVHVAAGDQIRFEAGALTLELQAIDEKEAATESGHKPLAPVLTAWFRLNPSAWDENTVRYVLAAARRIDMSNELFIRVRELEARVDAGDLSGPDLRRMFMNIVGLAELAVIALGRGMAMVDRAPALLGRGGPIPSSITEALPAVTAIRNDYEHIEDRALGTRQGVPHPTAAAVFDYSLLFSDDVIAHGEHRFNVAQQADTVIAACRETLKSLVMDADRTGHRSISEDGGSGRVDTKD